VSSTSPGVDEHHDPHPAAGRRREALAHFPAGRVVCEDVHLEEHARARSLDGVEHRGERRAAVAQQSQVAHGG